jgi:hypothetical protein
VRNAERRVAVALDYARGKEKKVASDLFNTYGVAVAGLDFKLPARLPPGSQSAVDADLCGEGENGQTTGDANKPASAGVTSKSHRLVESMQMRCWKEMALRTRRIEGLEIEAKAALAASGSAKERDGFGRLARELDKATKAANEAEREAGISAPPPDQGKVVKSSATVPTTVPKPTANFVALERRGDPSLAPYEWTGVLLLLLLGPLVLRREPFVLRDEPHFMNALNVWHGLLAEEREFAVPREVRRFQNRARYYAMRLRDVPRARSWFDRFAEWIDKSPPLTPNLKTKIREEVIVGLTAIHQVFPDVLKDGGSELLGLPKERDPTERDEPRSAFQDHLRVVRKYIADHDLKAEELGSFSRWPKNAQQLERFLEIAEEFVPAPETRTATSSAS